MTLDARSDARRQYEPMSPAERRARVLRRRLAGAADLLGLDSVAQPPTGAVFTADVGPAPPVSISTSLEPRTLLESVPVTDGPERSKGLLDPRDSRIGGLPEPENQADVALAVAGRCRCGFAGVDAIEDNVRMMPMRCERAITFGVPKSDCRSAMRLVSNLARSGSVSRRLQHMEPALIEDTGIANYVGAEFFWGPAERMGCAPLAPAQALYLATKFGDDAANVKAPRKAHRRRGTALSEPALKGANTPAPHKGKGKGKNEECKPDAGQEPWWQCDLVEPQLRHGLCGRASSRWRRRRGGDPWRWSGVSLPTSAICGIWCTEASYTGQSACCS